MINIIIKNIYNEKFEMNVETYDTILKNSTSITDYYKLIPAPPVNSNSEKLQSRPLSRGRKIKEKN